MEGLVDFEKEQNKGDEGKLVDFQVRLKARDFVGKQSHKSRDSTNFNMNMQLGGANLSAGPFNLHMVDPDI